MSSGVSFQEERQPQRAGSKYSGLEKLVLKTGLAKDKKGAQFVLLVVAGCAALLAGFLFLNIGDGGSDVSAPPEVFEPNL